MTPTVKLDPAFSESLKKRRWLPTWLILAALVLGFLLGRACS